VLHEFETNPTYGPAGISSGRRLHRKLLLWKDWICQVPRDRDPELVRYELWRVAQRLVDELTVPVMPVVVKGDRRGWGLMLTVQGYVALVDGQPPERACQQWEQRLDWVMANVNQELRTFGPLAPRPLAAELVEELEDLTGVG
jgi:hypothetical protein